jgi:hypothetical protein
MRAPDVAAVHQGSSKERANTHNLKTYDYCISINTIFDRINIQFNCAVEIVPFIRSYGGKTRCLVCHPSPENEQLGIKLSVNVVC